jgi:hypothetical protein
MLQYLIWGSAVTYYVSQKKIMVNILFSREFQDILKSFIVTVDISEKKKPHFRQLPSG